MENVFDLLNKKARDIVTGYTGTITGIAIYSHREDYFMIEGIDTTGRPLEWWLTRSQLEILD